MPETEPQTIVDARDAAESAGLEFARALPAVRERIAQHMALRGLPRQKVLATVVHLLETTLIRVGNDDYARTNKSYGLTTLRNPHVKVEGSELRFQFKGKSGKTWKPQLKDRRVARIVKACQELPGQDLFQYVDDEGEVKHVTSADVNAMQQLSMSFGLAVASLVAAWFLDGLPQTDHVLVTSALHRAFVVMGAITVASSAYFWPLQPDDDAAVSRGKGKLVERA